MNSEINLFIIWKNAQKHKERIINDIEKNFIVLKIMDINWTKKKFAENLTRFYGTNLPKFSHKQIDVGTGKFTLVVVKDLNPKYEYRDTYHGRDYVNVNMFDKKTLYRSWVGGNSRIHCTNNQKETQHDLTLLFGENHIDFVNHLDNYKEEYNLNLVGASGWDSLEQFFYVLNNTSDYVVLRNYEYLPKKYKSNEHGDIDILTTDFNNLLYIANAKKVFRKKTRVHTVTNVKDSQVYFDFRYIGDNYYSEEWEKEILNTKVLNENNIYIPNLENYKYSLAYHALIQKRELSNEYNQKLIKLFGKNVNYEEELHQFIKMNKYDYVPCKDNTVYFKSDGLNNKKVNLKRKIYDTIATIKIKLKGVLK